MPSNSSSGTRGAPYFTWEGVPSADFPLTLESLVIVDASASLGLSAGTPTVTKSNTIVDDGNAIALAAGTPTVHATNTVVDNGNAITLAAGTPTVTALATIVDNGNAINLAFGSPVVGQSQSIVALSASIALAAGTPKVIQNISALSASISLAAGIPTVTPGVVNIVALSASVSLAAGTPTVHATNTIVDDGNAISLAYGTPYVTGSISPLSASITLAAGIPTVHATNTIVDDGNTISLAAGTPTVNNLNTIVAQSAAIALAAGVPTVTSTAYILDDGNTISLTAGLFEVIGSSTDIVALSAPISLEAGMPFVSASVSPLSGAIDLAFGTPDIFLQDTIDDDVNVISLDAGTPTVTTQASIDALYAALGLSAGTPTVLALNKIVDNGNAINLAAGQPTVKTSGPILALSAVLNLTSTPTVISPQSAVLLGPHSAFIGEPILIASSKLSDTSRDDAFVSSISPAKWGVTATGATTISVNNGVSVELRKTGGGSSYQLLSTAQYASGDISVDYNILSDLLADNPVSEIVYVGLSMEFVTGEVLTIKRSVQPGFNGQQIQVEYFVGGKFNGGATRQTSATSGRLRLIKHKNIIAAVVDSDPKPLFLERVNPTFDFYTKIYSTTNGQNEYLKTKYVAYRSTVGALFGTAPLVVKNIVTNDRIIGTVPDSDATGPVDVVVFNHYGQIGKSVGGFEYPLVLGQSLSASGGFNGNVQGDSVIRN